MCVEKLRENLLRMLQEPGTNLILKGLTEAELREMIRILSKEEK